MSYSDLLAKTVTAAGSTPAFSSPGGASESTGKTLDQGLASSRITGRKPGQGPDLLSQAPLPVFVSSQISDAAILPSSSSYPASGIDVFPLLANDVGINAQIQDFNRLIASVRSLEAFLQRTVRYASGDLLDRLVSGVRYLNGIDSTSGVGSLRRPKVLTLGTFVTVAGTSTGVVTAPSLSLSSAQKTSLGMTTTVEALGGLSFVCDAKLQKPSQNPELLDSAASSGRCEARIDSNGTIQLFLCPGPHIPSDTTNSSLYTQNGGVPYLAPGLWYLTVVLYLSPYVWP